MVVFLPADGPGLVAESDGHPGGDYPPSVAAQNQVDGPLPGEDAVNLRNRPGSQNRAGARLLHHFDKESSPFAGMLNPFLGPY